MLIFLTKNNKLKHTTKHPQSNDCDWYMPVTGLGLHGMLELFTQACTNVGV
jgi:hypothetical protein